MRRSPVFALLLGLSVPSTAQQEVPVEASKPAEGALLGALATGEEAPAEAAARRLIVAHAAAAPGPAAMRVLLPLLASLEPFRRSAAARVLPHAGIAATELAAWAEGESDARALLDVVDYLPDVAVRGLLDSSSPEVAARAVVVLFERRLVTTEDFVTALLRAGTEAEPDTEPADTVARLLVERVVPFPRAVADQTVGSARKELLEALADRPRAQAVPFTAPLRAEPDALDDETRLLVLLAVPPEEWTRDEVRRLIDAQFSPRGRLSTLAADALDQLGPRAADRLVGEVHRRVVEGQALADLLPALHRISDKGERHLLALTRALDVEARGEIATWLARRDSPLVAGILAESLDGEEPLNAELLRRAGKLLVTDERVVRVVGILDESENEFLRDAAFEALIDADVYHEGLLDHALAGGSQLSSRGSRLASLPARSVPLGAWVQLLDADDRRVASAVFRRLAGAADEDPEIARLLEDRALAATWQADLAAAAVLDAGPDELAHRVWDGMDPARRSAFVEHLGRRRGGWLLDSLREFSFTSPELFRARLAQGDRALVEELLAEPERYDERTLRSSDSLVAELLRAEDGPAVVAMLDSERAAQRLFALELLAARADLSGADELQRIWSDRGADDEERFIALRGLARREATRRALLTGLDDALAGGLDDEQAEAALEVLGTVLDDPKVGASGDLVRLVVRLALVEPMARVADEFEDSLDDDAVFDGVAVCHAFVRTLSPADPELVAAAVEAAVAEVRTHPDFALLSRGRVGRLLAFAAAAEGSLLDHIGHHLAALILDLPDPDQVWVGPAAWVLSLHAEGEGDLATAQELAERAARASFRDGPRPMVHRAFFGDHHPGAGLLPEAAVAARPWLLAAQVALQADGTETDIEAALANAEELARGDREAEAEVSALREARGR